MNRYFAILFLPIIFFLSSCSSSTKTDRIDLSNTDFIYLKEKKFMHKGKEFFPVMINYIVEFRKLNDTLVLSPSKDYETVNIYESNNFASIKQQLTTHFQLIKEIGFNTLRIVFDRVCYENSKPYYFCENKKIFINEHKNEIISALKDIIKIAKNNKLRVMLLIQPPVNNSITETFTQNLLKFFQNEPTIYAYDFMNEPLYFDNYTLPEDQKAREKNEAFQIVSSWKDMMNKYAPFQLLTIGFAEPIEVFEWDPEILPVDFVSFHTYNPMRVMNEIYWYSKYINKPWMIGETSLPADNKINTYDEQREFLVKTFKRVVDCGGAGYGWWQFQEVPASVYEHAYTGIMNHNGITFTKDKKMKMIGTIKPAAFEIEDLKRYKSTNSCKQMVNYYNMLGYENIVLLGQIIDKSTLRPIEGAVIRGWNKDWSVGVNTFSNDKGIFTLFSNDICVHFEISAPSMSKLKFDYQAKYIALGNHQVSINNLPNKKLEYHSISYKNFLQHSGSIFDFDSTKFNKAYFKGIMEPKYLKKL